MCVATGLAVASLVLAVIAPVAGAVELVQITACGQSVNTDAVLVKNLTCADDGVTITGDGVTLDLGGFTIRSSTGTGRGIVVDSPFGSTATLRGPGKVRGFLTGIDARPHVYEGFTPGFRHHVIVEELQLIDNTSAMEVIRGLTDIAGATIRGVNGIVGYPGCTGNCDRVGTVNIDSSTIVSTGITFNLHDSGRFHLTHSQVTGGQVRGIINSFLWTEDSSLRGVQIECNENAIVIERSTMVDTTVSCGSSGGGRFSNNVIRSTRGGTALRFDVVSLGAGSLVEGNRFSGWTDAIGATPGSGVVITGNRFEGNVTGVRADCHYQGANGEAVRDNTFVRNTGDAIFLGCGQWAVGGNLMIKNSGLGINATGPLLQVTDEGGNIARGNAVPQCVGVVCSHR